MSPDTILVVPISTKKGEKIVVTGKLLAKGDLKQGFRRNCDGVAYHLGV